jgi:hypothetical protein
VEEGDAPSEPKKAAKELVLGTVVKFEGAGTGLSRFALREVFNSKMGVEDAVVFIDYTEGMSAVCFSLFFFFFFRA